MGVQQMRAGASNICPARLLYWLVYTMSDSGHWIKRAALCVHCSDRSEQRLASNHVSSLTAQADSLTWSRPNLDYVSVAVAFGHDNTDVSAFWLQDAKFCCLSASFGTDESKLLIVNGARRQICRMQCPSAVANMNWSKPSMTWFFERVLTGNNCLFSTEVAFVENGAITRGPVGIFRFWSPIVRTKRGCSRNPTDFSDPVSGCCKGNSAGSFGGRP